MNRIPHLRIVIAASAAAILGYAGFSVWVILALKDATMVGDIIGTWKSFAVLAFGFWLGSSSSGKAKEPEGGEPKNVRVTNDAADPIPTEEAR